MVPSLVNGFFTSRITIQEHDGTVDAHNTQIEGGWATLSGHGDVPCAFWPASAEERRTAAATSRKVSRVALLAGRFTTITSAHRGVVGGVTYNLMPSEIPSQGNLTRILLELVEP
jgi:hypothetical protein